MLIAILVSALAGATVLTITSRVLPAPLDAVGGVLGLAATFAGPSLLDVRPLLPEALYAGLAALFGALAFRAVYDFVLAASDAKVREIVRNTPRRVPPL